MIRILKQEWGPVITREEVEGGEVVFFASHPEVPGVDAMGETEVEARARWLVNMQDYAQDQIAHGARPPAFAHVEFEIIHGPVAAVVPLEPTTTKGAPQLALTRS